MKKLNISGSIQRKTLIQITLESLEDVLKHAVVNRAAWGRGAVLVLQGVYLFYFFFNRAAWSRGAVLVLHGVYFFNRAAVGVRGLWFTLGFLTARPGAEARF